MKRAISYKNILLFDEFTDLIKIRCTNVYYIFVSFLFFGDTQTSNDIPYGGYVRV